MMSFVSFVWKVMETVGQERSGYAARNAKDGLTRPALLQGKAFAMFVKTVSQMAISRRPLCSILLP